MSIGSLFSARRGMEKIVYNFLILNETFYLRNVVIIDLQGDLQSCIICLEFRMNIARVCRIIFFSEKVK